MILSDAGVNIPIVNAALSSVTPLTNAVAEPLQTVLKVVSQLPTAWAALRSALQNASSAISGLTANPDSTGMNLNPLPDGNLFEGTWSQPLSGSVNLGNAALKDFGLNVPLLGLLKVTAAGNINVTFGAAVQNGQPEFFIGPNPNAVTFSLQLSNPATLQTTFQISSWRCPP